LTFFQELLLGNPKDFGPWDFFMEPGSSLTKAAKNPLPWARWVCSIQFY